MPKKESTKLDRDDLIEAITDGRVMEALAKNLTVLLKPVIESIVRAEVKLIEAALKEEMEKMVRGLVDPHLKALNESVTALKHENKQLKERLDQQEAYSKSDNLLFYGVPESLASQSVSGLETGKEEKGPESNSSTCDLIADICTKRLGIDVGRQDISIAHRLRRGKSGSIRPIIVRFVSRQTRDEVYRARRLLRQPTKSTDHTGTAIFINEQLSKTNSEIYFRTRRLLRNKQISGTWTNGGEVFIKRTLSPDEKPTRITSLSDLPVDIN